MMRCTSVKGDGRLESGSAAVHLGKSGRFCSSSRLDYDIGAYTGTHKAELGVVQRYQAVGRVDLRAWMLTHLERFIPR